MNPQHTARSRRRALALGALALLGLASAGCASTPRANPQNAAGQVERARAEIEAGDLNRALDRLLAVRDVEGLVPEVRTLDDELITRCVDLLLQRYESNDHDSGDLVDLYGLELPTRLKARAGILAADRMLAEGSRIKAYRMVKKVDSKLPTHPERALAGDVVARSGLSLIHDHRHYKLLFSYRARGIDALEYLVLQYPSDPHCPEAYAALAQAYEDTGDLDRAIERDEELIYYHPNSPYTVVAEARSPYLRLLRLKRDDFDRGELMRAHQEVERWLRRHAGNELEPWVREIGRTCEARLASSDLILARYYRTWGSDFGTRLHAERALRTADAAQLEEAAAEARAILAKVPEPGVEVEVGEPEGAEDFVDQDVLDEDKPR